MNCRALWKRGIALPIAHLRANLRCLISLEYVFAIKRGDGGCIIGTYKGSSSGGG